LRKSCRSDFSGQNSLPESNDGTLLTVTCKINDEQFSFIGEPKLSDYNCSALIQKLNAFVAASNDVGVNSEHLIHPSNVQARIEDVNSEIYRNMINDLVTKNKDVIANKLCELGKAYGIKHRINTTGKVVYKRPRSQARANLETIDEEVDEMLKYEIIRPSSSPYSSPPHLTDKKDGGKRYCIDFRDLNTETIKDKFPIPNIDETKDYLLGARYFSTLDLISGYWQIEIAEEDKHKTAFTTRKGHYEFNRMPFGLTNAPATFQRLMNNLLQPVIYKCALVYLDDVIIYSRTIE
jgi:hypothetical protein